MWLFGQRPATADDGPPTVEITGHVSRSQFGSGTSTIGIRFAELAVRLHPSVRAYAQYDDGLTLDNRVLAAGGRHAAAGYVGALATYGEDGRYGTRLDLGYRSLPDDVSEAIVRAEQLVFFRNGIVPKVGAWVGRRSDRRTELILNGGVSLPVTESLRIEPMLFFSRTGFGDEREIRILLAAQYLIRDHLELGAGAAVGQKSGSTSGGASRDIFGRAAWRFSRAFKVHVLARHESIPDGESLLVLSTGLTAGF